MHSNKFLDPVRDGAVLPILRLNGYKIANPTILARIPPEELDMLFKGLGWTPHVVEGDDPEKMHAKMAEVLEGCVLDIRAIQEKARSAPAGQTVERPKWPMIILRRPRAGPAPKKWMGIRSKVSGGRTRFLSSIRRPTPRDLAQVEPGYAAIGPEELFDEFWTTDEELREMAPVGTRRIPPTRTPMAACCAARWKCRTFAIMRSRWTSRDRWKSLPPMSWRISCAM